MTLFTTLLVLIFERLFKLGEHWQLDHRLEVFFRRVKHFLSGALCMTIIAMGVTFTVTRIAGVLFNVPTLLVWLLIGLLCIGAGKVRLHYHAYLTAASRNDSHAHAMMAGELTMIHGVPAGCDERGICVSCKMHCCGLTFVLSCSAVLAGLWGTTGTRYADGYAFCVHGNTGWRDTRRRIIIVYSPALMPCFMYWIGCRFVLRGGICLDRSR